MLATKDTILNYIPQRAPMVMIHSLLEANDDHATTQFQIEAGNLFVEDGFLREPGLIENIAQTAAAHVGFQFTEKKLPIPVGFIAAMKDLEIFSMPAINSVVTTTVKIKNTIFDVTLIDGKVEQDGKMLCCCEMRIYVKKK